MLHRGMLYPSLQYGIYNVCLVHTKHYKVFVALNIKLHRNSLTFDKMINTQSDVVVFVVPNRDKYLISRDECAVEPI